MLIAEFEELMFLRTKLLTQMLIADQQASPPGKGQTAGHAANCNCERRGSDEAIEEKPAVFPCCRRYSLKEAAQLLGIPAWDVRIGMLKNEFIPLIGYVWQTEGRNCYCVNADMLDNYLRVKGMGTQRGKEGK